MSSQPDISHHLQGVGFPATKRDLVRCAKDNDARDDVLDIIESLPEEQFKSLADVMKSCAATRH